MIRLAAVGDVHCGIDMRTQIRSQFASVPDHADALLLAGDLTRLGSREAHVFADALRELRGVPTAAVLGNHDHQSDRQVEVRDIFERAGVHVLDGSSVTWEIGSARVGVAGTKGFGGGFEGTHATAFGERETKAYVAHTRQLADRLDACLNDLTGADLTILLLHYAPVRETLAGEPRSSSPSWGATSSRSSRTGTGWISCWTATPTGGRSGEGRRRDPRPQRRAGGDPAGLRRLHARSRPPRVGGPW